MGEAMNYQQLGQQFHQMRMELENSEEARQVRAYAAECRPYLEENRQDIPPEFSASLHGGVAEVIAPVKDVSEQLTGMATAVTGVNLSDFEQTGIVQKADITKGDSCMTGYLNADHPPMTVNNENEADMGVLAHFSYASKMCDAPEYQAAIKQEGLSVHDYCDNLLRAADASGSKMDPIDRNYLIQMRDSSRYGNMTVDHVYGNTGSDAGKNTVVMAIGTGDGHAVFSIQGTNGTVEDWQTDGRFAGAQITDEERRVNAVTNLWADEYDTISLTGHSQGGREANTAAIYMGEKNQAKIQRIVSNDGPGYSEDFMLANKDRIDAVRDKMVQYQTSPGSGVGQLLHQPADNIKYVTALKKVVKGYDKNGEPIYEDIHLGTTWVMDENGNYVTVDGTNGIRTVTDVLDYVVDFNNTVLGDEKAQEYTDRLMSLFRDENGQFSLKNIVVNREILDDENKSGFRKTLDYVGFLYDRYTEVKGLIDDYTKAVSEGMAEIRQDHLSTEMLMMYEFCSEASDMLDDVCSCLETAEKACIVLALLFPEAAPLLGGVIGILEGVKKSLKRITFVLKVVMLIINAYAYFKERSMRQVRQAYLSANPTMTVNRDYINSAIECLQRAATHAQNAVNAYEKVMSCYVSIIREAVIKMVDGVETEEIVERRATVPAWEGKAHAGFTTGAWPSMWNKIQKTNTVVTGLNGVLNDITVLYNNVNCGVSDNVFTVTPSALSGAGEEGIVESEMLTKETTFVKEQVNSLHGVWNSDDYYIIAGHVNDDFDESALGGYGAALKNMFEALTSYASAYSSFQSQTIENMQKIKL